MYVIVMVSDFFLLSYQQICEHIECFSLEAKLEHAFREKCLSQ